MKETDALDEYILQHIDEETDYLKALYRDTHVKLLRPRMASGHLQGRMLKMFVRMIRPKQILEIGTYSGYSALCLAEGLEDGGMLHTFEINDEQEDFTRPWLEQSPYADRIKFYIGDALELLPQMDITFDLAFVDGDKRKYIEYYEQVLKMLSPGGYIIADNTLWDGHVLEEPHHTDMQTIGIKKFNDLVATDKRVEKVILPLRDGLTIIRKNKVIDMETTRQNKVCRLIQKELSEIFLLQTKSMNGVLVSVSTVRISPDMSIVRAYLSVFPSGKADEIVKNINNNSKAIRFELGNRVRHQLRIIPELKFFVDDSLDYVERIDELLKK